MPYTAARFYSKEEETAFFQMLHHLDSQRTLLIL